MTEEQRAELYRSLPSLMNAGVDLADYGELHAIKQAVQCQNAILNDPALVANPLKIQVEALTGYVNQHVDALCGGDSSRLLIISQPTLETVPPDQCPPDTTMLVFHCEFRVKHKD